MHKDFTSKLIYLRPLFLKNKTTTNFQLVYKNFFKTKRKNKITKESLHLKGCSKKKIYSWSNQLFYSFLYNNFLIKQPKLIPHYSFYMYYCNNKGSNIGIFSIRKLIGSWNTIIYFISNIFYYNVNYVVFSNSYFKYETLSLNWNFIKLIKLIWRYTHPFIIFLNNKTTSRTEAYFSHLLKEGYQTAFVVDIHYHKKTIYYFNKLKFISIGPVPVTSNLYSLTVSMPVSSNSIFSNLFFFKLIIKLKKNMSLIKWESHFN